MDFQEYLQVHGKPVSAVKHEYLFRQGEAQQNLFIVKQGILKAQYVTPEGKEFIKSFFIEGDLLGSLRTVYQGEANRFGVLCLEDCRLVEVEFAPLLEKTLKEQALANDIIEFLLQLAMKKEQREYEFLCLSPEVRYDLILQNRPELLNRVTQKDIASYLGVTAVALSRIRGRKHKKDN